ncbi:MAG: hypothetical protein ABI986_08975 [Chloroflexota bacterium]
MPAVGSQDDHEADSKLTTVPGLDFVGSDATPWHGKSARSALDPFGHFIRSA